MQIQWVWYELQMKMSFFRQPLTKDCMKIQKIK